MIVKVITLRVAVTFTTGTTVIFDRVSSLNVESGKLTLMDPDGAYSYRMATKLNDENYEVISFEVTREK
jgi:maleate cis-trans isomerase